ncbi:helix-turn-helix domain-containing protein [Glycomyces sp. NRRL B-16210]|uniref:helix-turn-helix domain-containing protein n=1 Tax=Glycomyces sp. NRRL B-16210 TaxID=1463821 RepID=UPI00105D848A|nr:helix-turn-helix domain-containing protein [Glycomyces sp. NRRL B-16210]
MLSSHTVARRKDFSVAAVTCRDEHRGWTAETESAHHRIVLVRRGRFRRRADGVAGYADPTMGYLATPGECEEFAHPSGGDGCTSIRISEALWTAMAGDGAVPIRSGVYVDARLDLAHRRMLASGPDVDFAMTERLLALLAGAMRQAVTGPLPSDADASADRRLVATACEAIGAAHPDSRALMPLAALLDVSPYRLSRAFTRRLGVSLTHYRNRVRVGRALDLIESGATNLAQVAAELGFADQAHLGRTVKRHYGHTPTVLRRLLDRRLPAQVVLAFSAPPRQVRVPGVGRMALARRPRALGQSRGVGVLHPPSVRVRVALREVVHPHQHQVAVVFERLLGHAAALVPLDHPAAALARHGRELRIEVPAPAPARQRPRRVPPDPAQRPGQRGRRPRHGKTGPQGRLEFERGRQRRPLPARGQRRAQHLRRQRGPAVVDEGHVQLEEPREPVVLGRGRERRQRDGPGPARTPRQVAGKEGAHRPIVQDPVHLRGPRSGPGPGARDRAATGRSGAYGRVGWA